MRIISNSNGKLMINEVVITENGVQVVDRFENKEANDMNKETEVKNEKAMSEKDKLANRILAERRVVLAQVGGLAIDILMFINKEQDNIMEYFKSKGFNVSASMDMTIQYLNSIVELDGTDIDVEMLKVVRDAFDKKCLWGDCGCKQTCTKVCVNKLKTIKDKLVDMIDRHKELLDELSNTEFRGWAVLIKCRMDIEREQVIWICEQLEDFIWEV